MNSAVAADRRGVTIHRMDTPTRIFSRLGEDTKAVLTRHGSQHVVAHLTFDPTCRPQSMY